MIKERGLCYSWGKASFADRNYRFTLEWGTTLCRVEAQLKKKTKHEKCASLLPRGRQATQSSWCLDPIKFFNLKPYPKPLSTPPPWTSLSCCEHVGKGLCTVWQRLSFPLRLRIAPCVAMTTSSTFAVTILLFFFSVIDEVIIGNLLWANIFQRRVMEHSAFVGEKNGWKRRSITVKNPVRLLTGLN